MASINSALFLRSLIVATSWACVSALGRQSVGNGQYLEFGQPVEKYRSFLRREDGADVGTQPTYYRVTGVPGLRAGFTREILVELRFCFSDGFALPLAPFSSAWSNLDVGGEMLSGAMSKKGFYAYLAKWEARAINMGARKSNNAFPEPGEYAIRVTEDAGLNMIQIRFGRLYDSSGVALMHSWTILFSAPISGGPSDYSEACISEIVAACARVK